MVCSACEIPLLLYCDYCYILKGEDGYSSTHLVVTLIPIDWIILPIYKARKRNIEYKNIYSLPGPHFSIHYGLLYVVHTHTCTYFDLSALTLDSGPTSSAHIAACSPNHDQYCILCPLETDEHSIV